MVRSGGLKNHYYCDIVLHNFSLIRTAVYCASQEVIVATHGAEDGFVCHRSHHRLTYLHASDAYEPTVSWQLAWWMAESTFYVVDHDATCLQRAEMKQPNSGTTVLATALVSFEAMHLCATTK